MDGTISLFPQAADRLLSQHLPVSLLTPSFTSILCKEHDSLFGCAGGGMVVMALSLLLMR